MSVFLYSCEQHGELEIEHSIKEELECCPKCIEEKINPPHKLKKLISTTSFVLKGGGWFREGY